MYLSIWRRDSWSHNLRINNKTDLKSRKDTQMQKWESWVSMDPTSNMQQHTSRLQVGFSCVWPLPLKVDCSTEERAYSIMCQDFVTRKWVELFIFQQSPSRTQGRSVSNLRLSHQASSGSGRIEGRENNQVHVQERWRREEKFCKWK